MRQLLVKVLSIIAVVAVVYFANKFVQSQLGKSALNDLSFEVHSLQDALAISEKTGKLVLADYSAIWCPSCRKLDTEVFANESVANTVNKQFVYARLDYDSEAGKAFAATHSLVGFPRVLVLNTKGNKLVEMPLTFNPSEYKENLDKAAKRFLIGSTQP